MAKYAIGLDFGTESVRAVVVDVSNGQELGMAVCRYPHGVIDRILPASGKPLPPGWALQHPNDYLLCWSRATADALALSGVDAADVIGLGLDFTTCTLMPVSSDGTPLCLLSRWEKNPHAWVKLWKHHSAQPQAERITQLAADSGQPWLVDYGGRISSEWFFSKVLEILEEAPEVYEATDVFVEAADWMVWQLSGERTTTQGLAGYKAQWAPETGFPSPEFLGALHPRLRNVVQEKMVPRVLPLGARAGALTDKAAAAVGLPAGIAVAVANADAHAAVPASTVTTPGRLVMVMGTSICHLALSDCPVSFDGMCGCLEDGMVPGTYGVEAGQCSGGDTLSWFVAHAVPPAYHNRAAAEGSDLFHLLEVEAEQLAPGESGLLALDWLNGNRSVLVDADLQGVVVGLTLDTQAPAIYRALMESLAFGTRLIVDAFKDNGLAIDEIIAVGGLPQRNQLLMQIFADVTQYPIQIGASSQVSALGSAMHAAVAAGPERGGHPDIKSAAAVMARLSDRVYQPNPAQAMVYDQLYADYVRLHDFFGRGQDTVMKHLARLKASKTRINTQISQQAPESGEMGVGNP